MRREKDALLSAKKVNDDATYIDRHKPPNLSLRSKPTRQTESIGACAGTVGVDAQWATARLNQVPVVFSEDFRSGSLLEGVRFVNPFLPEFLLEEWL